MKTTIATAFALTLALPLANAWTIDACGQVFTGTGMNPCTTVFCPAGQFVDFDDGSTGRAIELSLYADTNCVHEITHFAGNESDYVLPNPLQSFLVLT
ncbi:hypothetical protein BJX99DRAFT_241170 [Aspergillus californicus]